MLRKTGFAGNIFQPYADRRRVIQWERYVTDLIKSATRHNHSI